MKALLHIKEALRKEGNPIRIPQMEAYMRNQFPFYGVMSTPRKELFKALKKEHLEVLDSNEKRALIQLLWEEEHRECQLVALDWLMQWKPKEFTASDIDLFEWLITTKSWWDTVDGIAPNVVGKYARIFPEQMKETLHRWESHDSFWIRRACLIFQLRYRQETDLDLLQYFINKFKPDREFFIQKAIGWSLREVSKWNPTWVARVVEEEQLTGLAKREASKYI
ncbi:MAG: DNA alkylation repair protein [Cryomorphaceae bacterium]|nr:DNA alkylation repair protein [Cryomorphaceae bacterium]